MTFWQTKQWFLNIKNNINNKRNNITTDCSGIYIMYIEDHYNSDKVIPFYIGKSKNILNRFQQHKTEVKKLIDLYTRSCDHFDFYEHYHLSKQSGKHLYSKIFYYLKEFDLGIDSLKIMIYQELKNNLEEVENHLINHTKSYIYGFNQIPFISQTYAVNKSEDAKNKSDENDLNIMLEYGNQFLNNFDYNWIKYNYFCFNVHEFIKLANIQIQRFLKIAHIRYNKYDKNKYLEFVNKFNVFCDFWKKLNIKYSFEF